jgi:uncharacterized protein
MPKPLDIPPAEVQRGLADENPWWISGKGLDAEQRGWPRRAYFPAFNALVRDTAVRRAQLLMGPRRVGKTVMLMHAIQSLLDEGVAGNRIMYARLDVPMFADRSLESLLGTFVEMFGHHLDGSAGMLWIFFDEIQYLRDWEVHLKSLVDRHKHVRFVASGSAAAAMRMKSRESGAGRFTDFVLPPLTFAEYLAFAGIEADLIRVDQSAGGAFPTYRAVNIDALNREFVNYVNYGGFPEAVMNASVRQNPSRYLKQDIVDKVLQKDLPSLYGIRDTQELNRFFNVLAYNTADEINLTALSKKTGIKRELLLEYLEYFEAAFLAKRAYRVTDSARRLQREHTFKVYLTNPSMRAALFRWVSADDDAMGRLAETAVWAQWLHSPSIIESLHYARWISGRTEYEVDLVSIDALTQKPKFAVEIKWSDNHYADWGEIKGIREFARQYPLKRNPLVTTRTLAGIAVDGSAAIEFVPTSLHCYTVAKNLLREPN